MGKTILIVDDDTEFSGLLTGVFEHADYRVLTTANAQSAFEALQREEVDLIVTDHRLPGVSGLKFIQQLAEMDITIPTIMVSGYLDDDTIRELIRSGVRGIFMKPLNIFSLLKKASDILANQGLALGTAGERGETNGASASVGGIRGLSSAGKAFVQRALEASSFRRQLLLIGPKGSPFEQIAKDLAVISQKGEAVDVLRPGNIDKSRLEEYRDPAGKRGIVYLVLDAHRLGETEVGALEVAAGSGLPVRLILCLHETVEALYDQGQIDENLYLFFGANELKIPALREMPEDVVALVSDIVEEHGAEPQMDAKLRLFLTTQPWNENWVELHSLTLRALNLSSPLSPQLRHFESARSGTGVSGGSVVSEREVSALERFLRQEKQRFLEAWRILEGQPLH